MCNSHLAYLCGNDGILGRLFVKTTDGRHFPGGLGCPVLEGLDAGAREVLAARRLLLLLLLAVHDDD